MGPPAKPVCETRFPTSFRSGDVDRSRFFHFEHLVKASPQGSLFCFSADYGQETQAKEPEAGSEQGRMANVVFFNEVVFGYRRCVRNSP